MSWSGVSMSVRRARRLAVFARDGNLCQLAFEGVCTYVAEVADHIRPRETYGDGLDNLQGACAACNGHKGKPTGQDPRHDPHQGAWW